MVAVLALAAALRAPGYDGRAFWVDELWRVNLILADGALSHYWLSPDLYTAITAPLYLIVNKLIAVVDLAPRALRLSSWLPGMASTVVAMAIVIRAGGSRWLAFAAGLVMAANVEFVRYSNEFKPYMFEVLVHLACLYAWLCVVAEKTTGRAVWIRFFAVLAIGALCTPNIVFILPAAGISVLDRLRLHDRRLFIPVTMAFAGLAAYVIAMYVLIWSYGSDKGLVSYWIESFHNPANSSYAKFALAKLANLWNGAFAAAGTKRALAIFALIALVACICVALIRRKFESSYARSLFIFYSVFVITLLVLNKAGLWPLGLIRPNQFVFAHLAVFFFLAVRATAYSRASVAIASIVVALVVGGVIRTKHATLKDLSPPAEQTDLVWAAFGPEGTAGKQIAANCGKAITTVFVNPSMSHAVTYFEMSDGKAGKQSVLAGKCVKLVNIPDAYVSAADLKQKLQATPFAGKAWFVYSHLDDKEVQAMRDVVIAVTPIDAAQTFKGAGYFSTGALQ